MPAVGAAVGQQIADFTNRSTQPIGESFYVETDTSGAPIVGNPQDAGLGRVIQGALESSNVNVVTELVSVIETQRPRGQFEVDRLGRRDAALHLADPNPSQ